MKGFAEVESDTKSLRGRAKAQEDDSGLLAILHDGFQLAGIPSLEALAAAFFDCLKTTYKSPDWRTLWRGSAGAAASVLGDCFGIRGGALRRKHDYEDAIGAYDQGFKYESETEFTIRVSYNRVQRLTVRIIGSTQTLCEPDDLKAIAVPVQETILETLRRNTAISKSNEESTVFEQLRKAESVIDSILQSTKPEERDLWQEADLALVRLLLGDDRPKEKLWAKIPSDSTKVYESTKKVIDDLAMKFAPSGPTGLKMRFEDTSNYFAEILLSQVGTTRS